MKQLCAPTTCMAAQWHEHSDGEVTYSDKMVVGDGSLSWDKLLGFTVALKRTLEGGKGRPARASHVELELLAMADVHSVVTRSHMVVAIAVKWMMVLVSMTYGDDGPRWREVSEAIGLASHG